MFNDTRHSAAENRVSREVRSMIPGCVLVRIFPKQRSLTHFYTGEFSRILASREQEFHVAQLVRRHFGNNPDWRHAHDFHVPTGGLYLTPHPTRVGYIPEDDFSFGISMVRFVATATRGAQ